MNKPSILGLLVLMGLTLGIVGCGESQSTPKNASASAKKLTCFGMTDPSDTFPSAALLTAKDAELSTSPPNEALDDWLGSSDAKKAHMNRKGWIELERTQSVVKFGLPFAGYGLIAQANVGRDGSNWKVLKAKPCTLTHSTPGHIVVNVYRPVGGFGTEASSVLRLTTMNDLTSCGGPDPTFQVRETTTRIAVTATYPWDAGEQKVVGSDDRACGGSVEAKNFEVPLKSALGSRKVVQSGFVPARPVSGLNDPVVVPLG